MGNSMDDTDHLMNKSLWKLAGHWSCVAGLVELQPINQAFGCGVNNPRQYVC
jgi:hypothetical protein